MPLFMDRHYIEGMDWGSMQMAHEADTALESKYDVRFVTYWFDEGRSTAFCLATAPGADSMTNIHSEAHGAIPNDVVEVDQTAVLSFMGRIADIAPSDSEDGRPVDRGLRTIMFTDLVGYTSMMSRLGDERAFELLREHNGVVRDSLGRFGGREVKHTGDGVMASFDNADQAVRGAMEIRDGISGISVPDMDDDAKLGIRIGMTSGEPLQEGDDLFGNVVNLASRLCDLAESGEILLSSECLSELTDDGFSFDSIGNVTIRGFEKPIAVSRVGG